MVPIRGALEKLATDLGKTYSDYNKLCEDNDIIQVFHNLITSFSFDQKRNRYWDKFLQAVVKTLGIHGIKSNLEKFEIPRMMSLAPEVRILLMANEFLKCKKIQVQRFLPIFTNNHHQAWTPESGLVTAAFKIKRKVIQTVFQSDIDHMYKTMVWVIYVPIVFDGKHLLLRFRA